MTRRKYNGDLTARGTPRKNIPIRERIMDHLRSGPPEGLTNDELCRLLYGEITETGHQSVRQALYRLRLDGYIESIHPPVLHVARR